MFWMTAFVRVSMTETLLLVLTGDNGPAAVGTDRDAFGLDANDECRNEGS